MGSASSELNDWLLLVVTGLIWLHIAVPGTLKPHLFHGLPRKVQERSLQLLAYGQFFFLPM